MTKRKRVLVFSVLGLGALQAALWFGYRAVTRSRRAPTSVSAEATSHQRVPMQAELVRMDGSATTLSELSGSRPVLLHFWATWCVPCQKELPTLLELARAPGRPSELELILVSLDQEWRPVEAFFDGAVPALVLRDGGALAPTLGVSTLPDTYLLGREGFQLARFHGARDWSAPELSRELERLLRTSP
jgi:thiol-disulfide isomerase/thioredoxin